MSEHRQFEISGRARLIVGVPAGRLDLYRSEGVIDVEVDGNTDGIEIARSGDTVSVTSTKTSGIVFGSTRLRIGVPSGCDFELSGASLDVHSDVALGHVRGRSASGDLSLRDAESLSIRSASGDIRFDAVDGDVDISMASGDVFGQSVRGALTASVASGDVRVDAVDGDVSAKSASGDIWISRTTAREVVAKSMSGTIAIGVAPRTRVNLDLSTLSGQIHRPSGTADGQEPVRTMDLRIRTVSGDIRLSRAD